MNNFNFLKVTKPLQQQVDLKISPPQINTHQGIILDNKAKNILLSSFVMLVLGKPGSGKTYLINQMLLDTNFYSNKFDRILYIGPTKYKDIIQDKYNTSINLDTSWLIQRFNQCKNWANNVLVVMDDIVSNIPNTKCKLQQIFYNRRHIIPKCCVSFIITTQKYTSIPTWLRVICNQLITFKINRAQMKLLGNQINCKLDKALVNNILDKIEPNKFIYFNLNNGNVYNNQFIQI